MKFLDDGTVNQKWLLELGRKEMADWIGQVIRGREPDLPDDPEEGHLFLAESYDELSGELRPIFRQALVSLLDDMANGPESVWRTDPVAGDRLVYLVGSVYSSLTPPDAEVVRLLLSMLEAAPAPGPDAPDTDIHGRILQAIMTLNVKMPFAFWEHEVQRNAAAYLGVGLRGASRSHGLGVNPLQLLKLATPDMAEEVRAEVEEVLEILDMDMREWLERHSRHATFQMPDWCKELLGRYSAIAIPEADGRTSTWAKGRQDLAERAEQEAA